MSRAFESVGGGEGSFPRVSGDEPPTGLIDWIEERFSPRERG